MNNVPRILPLVGVAVGGVLAINALAGAKALPDLMSGARAFAEDAVKAEKPAKDDKAAKDKGDGKSETKDGKPPAAPVGDFMDASQRIPGPAPKVVAPACAPTAAELAKEAGLSPAELQMLQSLGTRRGQLDAREQQLDVQLALLAAAEAKLDAKVKSMNALKAEINGLLKSADGKEEAELDRLVKVFEAMKPKDAAPRMVLLDDSVRLPIAGKMKERALSAILANMPAGEAKKLTEALARRFTGARAAAEAQAKAQAQAAAEPSKAASAAAPAKAPAKAAPKKSAKADKPPAPANGEAGAEPAPKAG